MKYEEITSTDLNELAELYVHTFNAPPWNDEWSLETAYKRLHQFLHSEGFYGLKAYQENVLCGMLMGNEEQFYDGVMFNLKEFCVKNKMQGKGVGSKMWLELEKRLKEKGISEIILFTSREDGTKGFYENRGLKAYDSMVMMGKEL